MLSETLNVGNTENIQFDKYLLCARKVSVNVDRFCIAGLLLLTISSALMLDIAR